MPVAFCHAVMVHHEKVHFKIVSTCSFYLVVLCTNELHHFDTAPFTLSCIRHIFLVNGIIERIMASGIVPRITFEAIYFASRHTVSVSGIDRTSKIHQNEKGTSCYRHGVFGFCPRQDHPRFHHIKGMTQLA